MSLFPTFEEAGKPALARALAAKLRALAERGVYFGTSSWKYEGWIGSIYSRERYVTRGKHSKAKFEADCLAEYAETFPTVCGDFAFYQFPSSEYWRRIFSQVSEPFTIGLKVPEDITVVRWPGHARYGTRAGQHNEHFLDAALFRKLFLDALAPYRDRVGPLIFEFGTFAKRDFPRPEDYFDRLDSFLADLPAGWRYSVEIRNAEYLTPAYFGMLAGHNVAHTFNAWTRMPALIDQIAIPDAWTADFTVVRALLARGEGYEQAVNAFEPYTRVQKPNPHAREALAAIARKAAESQKAAWLFVNNRLEGCAPETIEAVVEQLG